VKPKPGVKSTRVDSLRRRKVSGIIQESTREEILDLIDQRSRFLLNISGDEFMRRYFAGKLEHSPVEDPIVVLADLVASSTNGQ